MIHNIAEERKKRYRQDTSSADALTEEELLRLIGQVEERGLLHAPERLKEDVFCRIDKQRALERNRRLFSYRVKVLAGMAAALTVLLLLPIEGSNVPERTQTSVVNRFLRGDETPAEDEWEQEVLAREQEIDRLWERYRKQQERKDAGERYVQEIRDYFTDHFIWED